MSFPDVLKQHVQEVESIITAFLPDTEFPGGKVAEAMRYSFLSGGKRLRPMIMLESFRLWGGDEKQVYPMMAALEMIHTYSLIHDDLPAMDDDDLRRGRPTNHKVFGEATAILAGDALLNYSMETACRAFEAGADPLKAAKCLKVLYKKSGIYGMIGGQVMDLENENNGNITADRLNETTYRKTSALIEAAFMIGGILAGADEDGEAALEEIGRKVGLAFQMQDDLLDVISSEEEFDKPIGSDEKNGKMTFVTAYGREALESEIAKLSMDAAAKLSGLPGDRSFLEELIRYLIHRTY